MNYETQELFSYICAALGLRCANGSRLGTRGFTITNAYFDNKFISNDEVCAIIRLIRNVKRGESNIDFTEKRKLKVIWERGGEMHIMRQTQGHNTMYWRISNAMVVQLHRVLKDSKFKWMHKTRSGILCRYDYGDVVFNEDVK